MRKDPFAHLVNPIRVLTTWEEAVKLNEELHRQPLVAYDTEWYDYDEGQPVGQGKVFCAQFSYWNAEGRGERIYLHNYGESEGNLQALAPWLRSEKHVKTCHNVPVDWHITANHGIMGKGFLYDTMVADYLCDERRENRHGLKECAWDFLGRERKSFKETFGSPKLKKDGTPSASGQLIVPTLPEFVADSNPADYETLPADLRKRWSTLFTYATNDTWDGLCLLEVYKAKMLTIPWHGEKTYWDLFNAVDGPMTEIIMKMERRGMYLDLPFLRESHARAETDQQQTMASILEIAECPMNVASGDQLAALLYGRKPYPILKNKQAKTPKVLFTINGFGLPVLKTTEKGAASTDADCLKDLKKYVEKHKDQPGICNSDKDPEEAIRLISLIQDFNGRKTQIGTFLKGLQEKARGNRIHTRINQIGTTSGRWSSSGPNLQNITTGDKDKYHLRDAFCAPPGYVFVIADFSQLEYRLLTHFSQEPKLLKLYEEGWDLHSLTTYNSFPEVKAEVDDRFGGMTVEAGAWIAEEYPDKRKKAKTVNFGIIYGEGPGKFSEQLKIPLEEAKQIVEGWNKGYPYVGAWKTRMLHEFRTKGFVRTLDGHMRRADLTRLNHDCREGCRFRKESDRRCGIRGEEERTLINALIQGSAAAMCKKAILNIIRCDEFHQLGAHLIMQIHDELVIEAPIPVYKRIVELIRPLMERPFSRPLRVEMPVSIGVGPTWAVAKA
jgi:DNA polymerase I-like protein with 3'-5' exonuclease and polymerase domains